MSILYIPHGAGPMPLLGETHHQSLVSFLERFANAHDTPRAIVVISAHWETVSFTVNIAENHSLLFDYRGFPKQSYEITYPAKGSNELRQSIEILLNKHQIRYELEDQRGLDHGAFVPLKIMYPKAEVPIIQISLLKSLDPTSHIKLGEALSELISLDVLILGSGSSFHNMGLVHGVTESDRLQSEAFDKWLTDACVNPNYSAKERKERLVHWKNAPSAMFSHPREEHLLPLHVCFGAALKAGLSAQVLFNELFMGVKVSAIHWSC